MSTPDITSLGTPPSLTPDWSTSPGSPTPPGTPTDDHDYPAPSPTPPPPNTFPSRLNPMTLSGLARPHLNYIDHLTLRHLTLAKANPPTTKAALAALVAAVGPLPAENMRALAAVCADTEQAIRTNRYAQGETMGEGGRGPPVYGFVVLEERVFNKENYGVFKGALHEALWSAEEGVVEGVVRGHNGVLEGEGLAGWALREEGEEGEEGVEGDGGDVSMEDKEEEEEWDEDEGGDVSMENKEEWYEEEEEEEVEEEGRVESGDPSAEDKEEDASDEEGWDLQLPEEGVVLQVMAAVEVKEEEEEVREGVIVPLFPVDKNLPRSVMIEAFYDRLRMGRLWKVGQEVHFDWGC